MPKKIDQAAEDRFLQAIVDSNIKDIKNLVKEGYSLGTEIISQEDGSNALMMAVSYDEVDDEDKDNHLAIIQYLISISNLSATSNGDFTALHIALQNETIDPRIVQILVNAAPQTIDDYAIGLAENGNNPALFLTILGRPDLINGESYTPEQRAELMRQEDDYFNNNPSHRTMGKLNPNNPTILTVLIEPTYFDPLEAQKEINRFNDQLGLNDNKAIDDFLKTISFAPGSYMSEVSSNNDLSIIVAPQDILALLDRAQEFISGLTNYFFDSNGDNI